MAAVADIPAGAWHCHVGLPAVVGADIPGGGNRAGPPAGCRDDPGGTGRVVGAARRIAIGGIPDRVDWDRCARRSNP